MVELKVAKKTREKFPFFLCMLVLVNITAVDLAEIMKHNQVTSCSDSMIGLITGILVIQWMTWVMCTNMTGVPMGLKKNHVCHSYWFSCQQECVFFVSFRREKYIFFTKYW